jgi:hypothetical protein
MDKQVRTAVRGASSTWRGRGSSRRARGSHVQSSSSREGVGPRRDLSSWQGHGGQQIPAAITNLAKLPIGDLIETISQASLVPVNDVPCRISDKSSKDEACVASFNWIDGGQSTIAVPG